MAWLLLTLLGYPGSSSQQRERGGCRRVGPRRPGWGGMALSLCGRDPRQEPAKLTPPALVVVVAGGRRAGPAAVRECGPNSPSLSQHICTWFTVNESPVLMNRVRAPLPPWPLAGHPDTEPDTTHPWNALPAG